MALVLMAAARLPGQQDGFERMLERLVEPVDAELGFAMRHIETGEHRAVRGDERFPMASVYKLPIAIEVLHRVDSGRLSLDRTVRLTPADIRLGLGNNEVERLVGESGHDFTAGELLERMLIDSDNASSDALLALVGAGAVTRRMAELGSPGIRIDRSELTLLLDYIGAPKEQPSAGWSLEAQRERYRSAGPEQRKRAQRAFLNDPRDTATPNAMVDLLSCLHRREVPRAETLLDLMRRCETGARRLRGHLPESVVFAHRTGTSDTTNGVTAVTNDVGILTLPDGAGHVAIVAFLRMARGTMEERELVLARIGRMVFERYVGA